MSFIGLTIRSFRPSEYLVLEDFLYHAIFLPPGADPLPRDVICKPEIFVYIKDFGGPDDCGVVAEHDGKIIGAAWTRIIPAFSHIDDETPELAISVFPEHRGQGVGTLLLTNLFDLLREHGYRPHSALGIMGASGIGGGTPTVLPQEIVDSINRVGFFESIPLWAVTLIGGLFITVLSFIMIMSVYGRFFKLYLYTAIAPVPLSAFAGEPSQSVGKSFIKSYCAVCLEGAIIVLACIIFSVFASSPPAIDPNAAAVTQVWSYVGELIFNMLVLVGAVKMADRVVREMCGL